MSNLIPTPRTDKNGRTVVRHMKASLETVRPLPDIPTVGDLTQRISARNALRDYFKNSGWRISESEVDKGLSIWEEDSADTLSLIHKVLSNSDDSTLSYMDGYIGSLLLNRLDTLSFAKGVWREHNEETVQSFHADINRRWHALSVSEESGYRQDDPDEYFDWVKSTQSLTVSNLNDCDLPREDSYWRGVAALTLVQLENNKEIFYTDREVPYVTGFVEYAGTHPDIKKVLDVAVTRYIVDTEAIKEIIDDKEAGAAALGDGVI